MNRRRIILLFGNYDGTNIGDDCILLHILNEFSRYPNRILVPSRNPYYVANKYKVESIRLSDLNFISKFFTCDGILIGGGGIFSRYIGPYAKFLPLLALFSKLFGKKVIYYNIGIYKSAPFWIKELVKFSMLFSDEISVRDYASFETIRFLSKVKTIKIASDPGLTLKPIEKAEAKRLLQKEGVGNNDFLVGLSLKYTFDEELNSKIILEFSKLIAWLVEKLGATVVFFPFSFNTLRIIENDLKLAKKLKDFLKNKENNRFKIIKTWNYTPREIKGMIGLMDVFIGMRFHSIVFAYSMRRPLIGISYEEKCRDFLKSRKLPFLEVEYVDFFLIKQILFNVLKDRRNER